MPTVHPRLLILASLITLASFTPARPATAQDNSACSTKEPPLTANRPNIFSEQQEQWLGEAMAAQQEPEYTLLPEKDSEFLTKLGQKLLAQLPPTQIPYHFRVYESGELNGFSLAGGYVYASRKLIIDAKSEDEIAGVLAHEIGHIYTHQIASAMTRELRRRLDLTTLGTRDDVWDKYQLMLNAQPKPGEDLYESEAEKDELRADAVGLYAMMRAGYAPKAFAANLERIADSKGRNGNFLSDILDTTSTVGMRVRSAQKIANAAPDACKARELKSSPEFLSFQQFMASYVVNPLEAPTPGLTPVKLDSPIRPGLNWVRFSSDGQYMLAQNETYVYVMSASPLKLLFKVYAPNASAAHFTPDSKHLVFHFQSLRVENWDVETGKRMEAHELVEYKGCDQSELSPDGKLLACVLRVRDSWQISLELFDVASGKIVFSKSDGFLTDESAQIYRMLSRPDWDPELLAVAFSPDSHYMLVAAVASRLALDLQTLKPVKLSLGLGSLAQGRLAFVAPDQVLYDCDAGQRDIFFQPQANVCVAQFPTGEPVRKFVEGWESLWPVAEGGYLVAGTFYDSIPHLVDLTTGKIFTVLKFPAADVHGKLMASESGKGGVTVGEIGSATVESIELPEMPLPYLRAICFSPDGHYLALSNENRGAIWDISANKRMLLTRSFRGAWFDESQQLFLQLAAGQAKMGQNIRFDAKTGEAAETGKYDYKHRQLLDVSIKLVTDDRAKDEDPLGELVVYDEKNGNILWKRRYTKDPPIVTQNEPGVLILCWQMEGQTAWDETTHSSHVTRTSDETRDEHRGFLTELVNSQTGAVLRQIVSPEAAQNNWWQSGSRGADERSGAAFGKFIIVHGNNNNSVVYDAGTGARLMAFWGYAIAGSEEMGLIATRNRNQELVVSEPAKRREVLRLTLDAGIRAARFVPEKKQLLVVTSNQTLYTLDVSGSGEALKAVQ